MTNEKKQVNIPKGCMVTRVVGLKFPAGTTIGSRGRDRGCDVVPYGGGGCHEGMRFEDAWICNKGKNLKYLDDDVIVPYDNIAYMVVRGCWEDLVRETVVQRRKEKE